MAKKRPIKGGDFEARTVRLGMPKEAWKDAYAILLRTTWTRVILFAYAVFMLENSCFALMYMAVPGSISGARPGNFFDAFSFSVQTFSTIGYGGLMPKGDWANFVVSLESFTAIASSALLTGLLFSKFSRPTAMVRFTDSALIQQRNNKRCLVFRAANARGSTIAEASIQVSTLLPEVSPEGHMLRRLHTLKLQRDTSPIFALSWLVIHEIDETSPLFEYGDKRLEEEDVRIFVSLVGLDDTFGQTVHARHAYYSEDIQCGKRFADVIRALPGGRTEMDLRNFDVIYDE